MFWTAGHCKERERVRKSCKTDPPVFFKNSCSKNLSFVVLKHTYFHHGNHERCQINHKGKGHEIEAISSQTPNSLFCPLRSSCINPSHSTNSRILVWSAENYCFVSTWPWPLRFFRYPFLMFPRTPYSDLERGMNLLLSIKCRFKDKGI